VAYATMAGYYTYQHMTQAKKTRQ